MIKTGILGADSLMAGELIRILVNHPEVELISAFAPSMAGIGINRHHAGLIGETELRFADKIDLNELNLLFVDDNYEVLNPLTALPEELRIVFLSHQEKDAWPEVLKPFEFATGISELFRKPMVRGAKGAALATPPAVLTLIALYPLAKNLLLPDDVDVQFTYPKGIEALMNKEKSEEEINSNLKTIQRSFQGISNLTWKESDNKRAIHVRIEMHCSVALTELLKLYDAVYDDHHFTFVVNHSFTQKEVEGTHKCLLHLSYPTEGRLVIEGVADGLMRGGAGDAVHSMNLLFGLFEKIGLNFKAPLAF